MTALATIGDNNPPAIEAMRMHVEDLLDTARQFLDGAAIETQAQADDVGKVLAMLREAGKDAERERKAEKEPHLEAGRAVDATWKPLTEKISLAEQTAKKALAPFLIAEQARRDAEALAARRAADEAAERARQEIAKANAAADLAARERAEELVKEAEQASKAANKLDGARAGVAGGARAVSLRTRRVARLVDPVAALKHYKAARPEELKVWLLAEAQRDATAGATTIPGFAIDQEQVAA